MKISFIDFSKILKYLIEILAYYKILTKKAYIKLR